MNKRSTSTPLGKLAMSNHWKMTSVGIYLLVLLLLAGCGAAATPPNQTPPTGPGSPTTQSTPITQSTPSPTPTYMAQPPVLAGDLRDFIHQYGQPTSSNPSAGAYHFSVYSDEDLTVLIEHNHVSLILLSAPNGAAGWSEDQAKQKCDGFVPPDRVFSRFYTVQDNQLLLVWVFNSQAVAQNLNSNGVFHEAFFTTDKLITDCQLALGED